MANIKTCEECEGIGIIAKLSGRLAECEYCAGLGKVLIPSDTERASVVAYASVVYMFADEGVPPSVMIAGKQFIQALDDYYTDESIVTGGGE
jgi:hypothetical protein